MPAPKAEQPHGVRLSGGVYFLLWGDKWWRAGDVALELGMNRGSVMKRVYKYKDGLIPLEHIFLPPAQGARPEVVVPCFIYSRKASKHKISSLWRKALCEPWH